MVIYNPKLKNQKLNGIEWNADCPFCGKEKHFYLNSKTGLWNCKRCGEFGNWFQFRKKTKSGFTNLSEIEKEEKNEIRKNNKLPLIFEKEEENKLDTILLQQQQEKEFVYKKPPTISLPDTFIKITKNKTPDAFNYILKRGYDESIIEKYNLMYGTVGNFFNRIIIPVYLNGKLKGYLGRWIEIEGYKPKRKYRNSYGTDFSKLLGNYDLLKEKQRVVICEGAFSSYRVAKNSVFSFGKKLSKEQIYLLKKKRPKEILLFFDSDAQVEIINIAEKLVNENLIVRILLLDEGDPDDLREENLYERIFDESKVYKVKQTIPIMKLKI